MGIELGKILITAGFVLVFIGVVVVFREQLPFINRLGRLPGDIIIERENFTLYFPITTGLLVSLILTGIGFLLKLGR